MVCKFLYCRYINSTSNHLFIIILTLIKYLSLCSQIIALYNIRHYKKHRKIKIVKDNYEDCLQYAVMQHGCYWLIYVYSIKAEC